MAQGRSRVPNKVEEERRRAASIDRSLTSVAAAPWRSPFEMSSHRPSGHDPPTGNSGKVPGLLPKHPGDNPAQHAILRFLATLQLDRGIKKT